VLIVPVLAIFTARGLYYLICGFSGFVARIWTFMLGVLFFVLMIYLNWQQIQGLYQINNPVIVEAGQFADQILPKEAIVLAPYNGDTAFLYQINRPGWATFGYPVKDLIDMFGVTHYVSTTKDTKTNWLMNKYQTIENNERFVILDLRVENPNFYQDFKDQLNEPN
jgi:hypothetical protein